MVDGNGGSPEGENRGPLLAWQFALYPAGHRSRRNLLIHSFAVPLFWAGNIAMIAAPFTRWWLAIVGVAAMGIALALQGRGHAGEAEPPVPFTGPGDAVKRLFVEQWITFPRFVLSGGWWRALRAAPKS